MNDRINEKNVPHQTNRRGMTFSVTMKFVIYVSIHVMSSWREKGNNKYSISQDSFYNYYTKDTAMTGLHKDTDKLNTGKGVRKGSTSPKLFTVCLESILRYLN